MKTKPAAPLDRQFLAFDKQVAMKYVTYLVEKRIADQPETRLDFCRSAGIHPKLLYNNPHLGAVSKLFQDQSNLERLGDLTLREFLAYQYHYLRQGHRFGAESLQPRWLGHPVLKSPLDCWVYQEIVWETRPDVVIELGVEFGGGTHFFASLLELLGHGEVIGIDPSLARACAPESPRITYVEGAPASAAVLDTVRPRAAGKRTMVVAGAQREKAAALEVLQAYAPLVHVGGYLVVEDSLDDLVAWRNTPSEGPMAAVRAFLATTDDFVSDRRWAERYVMTLNPNGFLLRVK